MDWASCPPFSVIFVSLGAASSASFPASSDNSSRRATFSSRYRSWRSRYPQPPTDGAPLLFANDRRRADAAAGRVPGLAAPAHHRARGAHRQPIRQSVDFRRKLVRVKVGDSVLVCRCGTRKRMDSLQVIQRGQDDSAPREPGRSGTRFTAAVRLGSLLLYSALILYLGTAQPQSIPAPELLGHDKLLHAAA